MKIKTHYIKVILLIILILALFFTALIIFSVYARYKVAEKLDIGYGASTSGDIVRLEIGDRVFDIPKNHIWSREDWRGGKVEAVNLRALLPDFEPYLDSNKAEFEELGWNKVITFVISHHNTAGSKTGSHSMTRQAVYDRVVYDFSLQKKAGVTEFPGPYGLTLQVLNSTSSDAGRELYVGYKKDGGFYWVSCGVDKPQRYPSCETYLDYSNRVYLSYRFSKKYLEEWESIDNSVFEFISKFEEKHEDGSNIR